jgi:hypothetical protein
MFVISLGGMFSTLFLLGLVERAEAVLHAQAEAGQRLIVGRNLEY